jgi:hypothetical protein
MSFNLWNPVVNHDRVVFDATPRETAMIGSGSAEFVTSCLVALRVPATGVDRWMVRTVRQCYYSDYPHSTDWRARWDVAWRFDVWLSRGIDFENAVRAYPFEVVATDPRAADDEPVIGVGAGLVMGVFPPKAPTLEALEGITAEWRRHRVEKRTTVSVNRFADGYCLLRIAIHDADFPADIDHFVALNDMIQRAGGLTTWRAVAAARKGLS